MTTNERRTISAREARAQLALEYLRRVVDAAEVTSHWTQRYAEHMGQHNDVLESGYGVLDSGGGLERTYRAPYASIMVLNATSGDVTVSSDGRGGGPPGPGAGAFVAPAGSAVRMPLVGRAVTFYGPPGGRIGYAVLANPTDPFAAALTGGSGGGGGAVTVTSGNINISGIAAGSTVGLAAGTTVALAAGTQVTTNGIIANTVTVKPASAAAASVWVGFGSLRRGVAVVNADTGVLWVGGSNVATQPYAVVAPGASQMIYPYPTNAPVWCMWLTPGSGTGIFTELTTP
jgi:hypothetical protein